MPLHDFECSGGHQFEKEVGWDVERKKCPECGKWAERVWMSRRSGYRYLETPMVVHKMADGSYSFPARADAPTPVGAERVEMRSFADYRREIKKVNEWHRSSRGRYDEELQEKHEIILKGQRADVISLAAQTDNPFVKDLCRLALESYSTDRPASSFGEIWNRAMESSERRED